MLPKENYKKGGKINTKIFNFLLLLLLLHILHLLPSSYSSYALLTTLHSREWNREHARKTRLRKKAHLESLKSKLSELQKEAAQLSMKMEESNTANILLCLGGSVQQEPEGDKLNLKLTSSSAAAPIAAPPEIWKVCPPFLFWKAFYTGIIQLYIKLHSKFLHLVGQSRGIYSQRGSDRSSSR